MKAYQIISIVFFSLIILSFIFFIWQFLPVSIKANTQNFVVPLNFSYQDIVSKLKNNGYIRSDWAFNFAIKEINSDKAIQPGGYFISKKMSTFKIAEILTFQRAQVWITIPEGKRKEEIVQILKEALVWQENDYNSFISTAREGYLFPETYLIDLNLTPAELINLLENQFNKEFNEIVKNYSGQITKEEIVILASLIEREAKNKEEMPQIANVFLNRLNRGMKLDIDATLQYIFGTPQNWWPKVLPEQKNINSPYNTYLYKGLPPGPICNPGSDAIRAVISPQQNDFFYYFHAPDGTLYLSKTYQEHLYKINKYLK
jgi:UPF0755 protein